MSFGPIPGVKIKDAGQERGWRGINASDFDPEIHELWEEEVEEEPSVPAAAELTSTTTEGNVTNPSQQRRRPR